MHPLLYTAFIEDSDVRTKFYTGLPTYMIFTILFDLLSPLMKKSIKLSLKDELLLCLMKLRLNLTNEDLAYRFGVAKSTVSRIFHKWLDVMYVKMKSCIRWPDKETVRQTLPNVFIKHFQNVRCTIDLIVQKFSSSDQHRLMQEHRHTLTIKSIILSNF